MSELPLALLLTAIELRFQLDSVEKLLEGINADQDGFKITIAHDEQRDVLSRQRIAPA